ncbi:MAG: divergent polysaccharide deacetylase family protein [Candidatus Omnitrophica bacterium]|nr:divergent polysaccharide deacetylase family protein [Candidatus Omnitrophota bacterium]
MNTKQLSSIITFGVIALIAITVFILRKTDYSYLTNECDKIASDIIREHEVNTETPLRTTHKSVSGLRKKAQSIEKEFLLPQRQSLPEIKKSFISSTAFKPVRLGKIQKKQTKKEHLLILDFFYKGLKLYRLILRQKIVLADIALVIDDWGYSNKVLRKSLSLGIPLTYAVLPCLPYSTRIAQIASDSGHEVILHLPLEPHNAQKHPLEKNTIFTSMSKEKIESIIKDAMASVPNLKGINNHMGSKATESEYVLNILFDQIKKNSLYFLDSCTSNKTLVTQAALQKGISFIRRDVFIDNVSSKDYIKGQLLIAKNIAAEKGKVIAIGHAKDLTLDTLQEIIPELEREGFRFVLLSALLNDIKPPAAE